MMYGHGGYGGLFGGWIPMFLSLIVVVCVVYLVIYFFGRREHTSHVSKSSAEELLRERYARGEIDTETFLEMKRHLQEK